MCILSWNLHVEEELGTREGLFFPGPYLDLYYEQMCVSMWELGADSATLPAVLGCGWEDRKLLTATTCLG